MESLNRLLSVQNIAWQFAGYPLSYLEVIGIVSGILSVSFAAQRNVVSWSIGLVNEAAFFLIFYQVQLYAEMILQVIFALFTVYGWVIWRADAARIGPPSILTNFQRILAICAVCCLTLVFSLSIAKAHTVFPDFFPLPAASPLQDGFTAAASIVAICFLAWRVFESWFLWITVDLVSASLYFERGIPFMGALYLFFFLLALYGLMRWIREFSVSKGEACAG